jgi:hypothetical protein
LSVLVLALTVVVATRYEALLVRFAIDRRFALQVGLAGAGVVLLELALSLGVLRWHARRPRRSQGRGRFLWMATGGLAHALGSVTAAGLIVRYMRMQDLVAGFGVSLPKTQAALLSAASAVIGGGMAIAAISALASWPLLTPRVRNGIWLAIDLALLAGVVSVTLWLPSQPPIEAPRALGLPILRHIVTTLFVLRLLVRMLPLAMNSIERIGFQPLVAARHLRSKKSGFLAAISLLSILAVTVSCVALTGFAVISNARFSATTRTSRSIASMAASRAGRLCSKPQAIYPA